jgi:mono/diheme cytochrome c family protein
MNIGMRHWITMAAIIALPMGGLSLIGCQQKMAEQPSFKELEPCDFFADGRSERPAVPGAVARGHLQTDIALFTGRRTNKGGKALGSAARPVVQPQPDSPETAKLEKAQYEDFVDDFPVPMTQQVLEHGYHRFMIYCVVCHDPLGTGQGKIVERGYTAPPSYHIERLRKAPVGYLFAVMSDGYGSMPSYGAQISVRDRWAIAGYVRALQASQHFAETKLMNEMREEWSRQEKPVASRGQSP